MFKRTLSLLLLGGTLIIGSPSNATASSFTIDGVECIKEQDAITKNIRIKTVFTDGEDLQEIRNLMQNQSKMQYLNPLITSGAITFQDKGDRFILTAQRHIIPFIAPYINDNLEENGYYLNLFDSAPARSVLFTAPRDFNATIYALYNPDVTAAHNTSLGPIDQFLVDHYTDYGFGENRRYQLPERFSSESYLKLNPDVALAASGQRDPNYFAISHYIQHGEKENRSYCVPLPISFNAYDYLALNPDIAEAARKSNLDKEKFAKQHYLANGFFENRSYLASVPSDFNAYAYLGLHKDLENAFGALGYYEKVAAAKVHYVTKGKDEGRRYK